jgi:hypothetical protein
MHDYITHLALASKGRENSSHFHILYEDAQTLLQLFSVSRSYNKNDLISNSIYKLGLDMHRNNFYGKAFNCTIVSDQLLEASKNTRVVSAGKREMSVEGNIEWITAVPESVVDPNFGSVSEFSSLNKDMVFRSASYFQESQLLKDIVFAFTANESSNDSSFKYSTVGRSFNHNSLWPSIFMFLEDVYLAACGFLRGLCSFLEVSRNPLHQFFNKLLPLIGEEQNEKEGIVTSMVYLRQLQSKQSMLGWASELEQLKAHIQVSCILYSFEFSYNRN